jgi:membrane-bound lytic murein transglycosylase B
VVVDDTQDQVVEAEPVVVVENPRLACIRRVESHNDPNATNRYSGAMGLYQFLPSTWRTTPQGRAGLSAYDPVAATAAANWMLSVGRAREWVAVSRGYC